MSSLNLHTLRRSILFKNRILIVLFLGISLSIAAQDKQQLTSQISQLEKEIAYTNTLIAETQKAGMFQSFKLNSSINKFRNRKT